jgi:uncharacterized protein (TIGR02145 family)
LLSDAYGNTKAGSSTLDNNKLGSTSGTVAVGDSALKYNYGRNNTAIGSKSMQSKYLSSGSANTAIGNSSLYSITSGVSNTASGASALLSNTTGSANVASGNSALYNNTTGSYNIAYGNGSLMSNIIGNFNTAIGYTAGKLNVGDKNIFIGNDAGNNNNFKNTSNKLVIQNDSSLTPLIYGEFDTKKIIINGKLIAGELPEASSSAVLEASSTTQGFLPPRLTYAQKMAITRPVTGLVVFCTDCGPPSIGGELEVYSGGIWRNMIGAAALGVAATLSSATIGTQVWTNKNLDVTTYRNGDIIPKVTDATTWAALTTGAWCFYNNDSTTYAKYGKLYNWYAVNDPRGLAPTGYHIPSDAEWTTLGTTLGGESVAGAKMKESGTLNWYSPNLGATNESGFAGLPGGNRYPYGVFDAIGNNGIWWSSTEVNSSNAYNRYLGYDVGSAGRSSNSKQGGLSVRCLRDSAALGISPTVASTTAATSITATSATSGGNITSDGGSAIIARGVCWSTSRNPTTAAAKTTDAGTIGNFTSSITGLVGGTTYYVRSYATNASGTEYGSQASFSTTAFVTIGTQVWTNKNLDVSTYRNGDIIPQVTDATTWAALTTGAWCYYNNDSTMGAKFGKLYNWYAVNDPRGIAPTGWHVPTDTEWTTLTSYLGGKTVAGGKMKEAGTLNWLSPNTGATNESGFTGLPGGLRDTPPSCLFYTVGVNGYWWSTTTSEYFSNAAWYFELVMDAGELSTTIYNKGTGLSVRCLRD